MFDIGRLRVIDGVFVFGVGWWNTPVWLRLVVRPKSLEALEKRLSISCRWDSALASSAQSAVNKISWRRSWRIFVLTLRRRRSQREPSKQYWMQTPSYRIWTHGTSYRRRRHWTEPEIRHSRAFHRFRSRICLSRYQWKGHGQSCRHRRPLSMSRTSVDIRWAQGLNKDAYFVRSTSTEAVPFETSYQQYFCLTWSHTAFLSIFPQRL